MKKTLLITAIAALASVSANATVVDVDSRIEPIATEGYLWADDNATDRYIWANGASTDGFCWGANKCFED